MKLSVITALAAGILALPAMADAPAKYIAVPGTDTAIQIYGRVTFDAVHDFVQPDGVLIGLSGASADTSDDSRSKNQWDMTAACSRFGLRTVTPSQYGDVKTRFEMDFNGTNKDSAGSPHSGEVKNYAHVRQMYGEFNGWLFGKTDSNWMDPDGSPNYIDEDGLLADCYGVGRISQIRYTAALNEKTTLALSFEQNSLENISGLDTGKVRNDWPGSFVGRLGYADKWGHISFSGAVVRYSNMVVVPYTEAVPADNTTTPVTPAQPAVPGSTTGRAKTAFSWMLSGTFNLAGDDSMVWQFGEGNGQYGASLQDGAKMVGNDVEIINSRQALLGYEHFWTPKVHSNVFGSLVSYQRDAAKGMTGNAFHTYTQYGFNTLWNATRTVQFGAEYIWGEAKTFDSNTIRKPEGGLTDSVHESKLHFQVKYSFN
jgi:hypothetical protein